MLDIPMAGEKPNFDIPMPVEEGDKKYKEKYRTQSGGERVKVLEKQLELNRELLTAQMKRFQTIEFCKLCTLELLSADERIEEHSGAAVQWRKASCRRDSGFPGTQDFLYDWIFLAEQSRVAKPCRMAKPSRFTPDVLPCRPDGRSVSPPVRSLELQLQQVQQELELARRGQHPDQQAFHQHPGPVH